MSEDSGGLSNSNHDEPQEEIGENLPASFNGDDEELQEVIGQNLPASFNGEEQHLVEGSCSFTTHPQFSNQKTPGKFCFWHLWSSFHHSHPSWTRVFLEIRRTLSEKEQQGQHLRIISPVSPARLYCCYAVITVLTAAVIALSVALSLSGKTEQVSRNNTYAVCPKNWIGIGNTCFYFSEDEENWTSSQKYCIALEAQLARFDNHEELNFLKRYKGPFDHWIGLHRESSQHPWMWTDNTEYNNLILTRGEGNYAYLSDRGISSGRDYIPRKWICSKPNSYTLQCPGVSQFV